MTGRPDLPDDERLRRLLDQTLADVEPRDQLEAIRSRTKVTPMSSSASPKRPWVWGWLGAAVATAAVIGGVAVLKDREPSAGPAPVGTPSPTPDGPTPTAHPSPSPTGGAEGQVAAAVYYVGDTPDGPRLYREFHRVDRADVLGEAVGAAAGTGRPQDPDYRSDWAAGTVVGTSFDGIGSDGLISILLADGSVRDRPAGMSAAEAEMAVQALIYTAQAATQARAPVQFFLDHNPIDQVYGVPTAEPLAQGKPLDVLSLMSITSPAEGQSVSGTFEASGVNNSFEATVAWQLRRGDRVVRQGAGIADGWMAEKLFPWKVPVDVSGVAPGTYTFVALNDDPSGAGPGPHSDSRTVIVK